MKKVVGLFTCFLLWYILSIILSDIIPYPHDVISAFIRFFPQGLNEHLYASIKRLLIGLLVAIILGIHIGLLLGLHKLSDQVISPFIYGLYPIPKAALLPIFIIIFGIGDITKILLIIFIVIFPIIIQTRDTVSQLPKEVFYVSKSLSLSKLQIYKEIIIPAILPNLLTSIRLGIGTAVAVLFLSESFTTGGLGYYIAINLSINNLKVFVGIFSLSMIGYGLFILVDFLQAKLCKWV